MTCFWLAAGCEDALMPHGGLQDDMSDPRDLERHNEEVRLLYVGMTRAKQQLYLLHARERALRGGMQRFGAKISPFLQSIPGCAPAPSRSDRPSHSSQNMQHQTPRAAYRYTHVTETPHSRSRIGPSRWQITSASREQSPPVADPVTRPSRTATQLTANTSKLRAARLSGQQLPHPQHQEARSTQQQEPLSELSLLTYNVW